jgi:hypothetical protein
MGYGPLLTFGLELGSGIYEVARCVFVQLDRTRSALWM